MKDEIIVEGGPHDEPTSTRDGNSVHFVRTEGEGEGFDCGRAGAPGFSALGGASSGWKSKLIQPSHKERRRPRCKGLIKSSGSAGRDGGWTEMSNEWLQPVRELESHSASSLPRTCPHIRCDVMVQGPAF